MEHSYQNRINIGLAFAAVIFGVTTVIAYRSMVVLSERAEWVNHTRHVLEQVEELISTLKDAETGQRGYIITGREEFLEPYREAIPRVDSVFQTVRRLTADNPLQQQRLDLLGPLIRQRLDTIKAAIDLRRMEGFEAAMNLVSNGPGKGQMDAIRNKVAEMKREENALLEVREAQSKGQTRKALLTVGVDAVLGLAIFLSVFFLLNREIGERKRAEKEMQQLNAALEAANKELEAFSYTVSHDLRAPLRSISGFSQVLVEDYGDALEEEGKDAIGRIQAATQRMGRLIDDLLKLAQVSRSELHKERVDLSREAQAIAAELKAAEPGRAVAFEIQEGLTAEGDPRLLRVVLTNLIQNAWKFTRKKGEARIEFGAVKKEGKTVYFVRDNGAGFDMAYVDKLFAPFQRLHGAGEFEGTGIGLATIQRIIRRHGGEVRAEGEVDRGATFSFTL